MRPTFSGSSSLLPGTDGEAWFRPRSARICQARRNPFHFLAARPARSPSQFCKAQWRTSPSNQRCLARQQAVLMEHLIPFA